MEWYYIVLIILGSLLLLFFIIEFIIAYFLMNYMLNPYCKPLEEVLTREADLKKMSKEEYENYYIKEEFTVKSKFGYNLKAFYIPKKKDVKFKDGKERVVVLCHGWTARHETMLAYGKIYLEQGFHVFAYDHRNHGFSDKKFSTLGAYEADDLQTVIEEIYKRMGYNIIIGTQGESMGSATAMIHAGRYHSVDFVSEDCGFDSLYGLMYFLCKYKTPFPVFPTILFSSIIFKLKTKRSLKDAEPIKMVATCDEIPMNFSHGDKDDFVPSFMSVKCYDAKPGFKTLHIYDCDIHARDLPFHKEQYYKDINEFLLKANIIDEVV